MEREFIKQKIGSLFQCSPLDAQLLAALFTPLQLKKSELYRHTVNCSRSILYLKAGLVHYQLFEQNNLTTAGILQSNDVFFVSDTDFQEVEQWRMTALLSSTIYVADCVKFETLLFDRPHLVTIYQAMHRQYIGKILKHMRLLKSQTAAQRYLLFKQQFGHQLLDIPYQVQAAYMAISRKHLSRIIQAH